MRKLILGDSPRRTVAAWLIAAVVVPALAWVVLGMPAEQALLLGAIGLLVAALVRFPPDGFDLGFPEPPTPVRDRGARREAFRLSWNVAGRQDQVGSTLITRVQQIAARRLADHGLDLTDPADAARVVEIVGQPAYRVLTLQPGSVTSTRAFNHTLAAVERLADLPPVSQHAYGVQEENR